MAIELTQDEPFAMESGEHLFDGLCLGKTFESTALDAAKTMVFYPEDVMILSYPKSGSTWLQEITWLVTHDANVDEALCIHQTERVPHLEIHFPHHPEAEVFRMSKTPPRVIKSHLPSNFLGKQLMAGGTKVIIIQRDLKDTLVSFYNHYKNHAYYPYKGSWNMFFDMFKKKALRFGDWGEFYKGWQKYKDHPNFLFLKYETLKVNPTEAVWLVAKHCNKILTDDQVNVIVKHTSFSQMKGNAMVQPPQVTKFFRKGVLGDWSSYFSEDQIEYINKYEQDLVSWE